MIDLDGQRRFFAEEIQAVANLRSPAVVEALARVPREQFLPPGPWMIRSDADFGGPPRQTPGPEPRHVYHNVAVAIDPARMLFNGAPGLVGMAIDALALERGHRVLHVGAGTGYFTALMAHCVGADDRDGGRVVGIEIDETLAARAAANLAARPGVDVRQGDAATVDGPFDAILINAGVTHLLDAWLDALAAGGRLIAPITAAMPGSGAIGKGMLLLLTRTADADVFDVRPVTFVAIYSAVGLRDDALNAEIGKALAKHPFPPLRTFRRAAHEPSPECWLHGPRGCLSTLSR